MNAGGSDEQLFNSVAGTDDWIAPWARQLFRAHNDGDDVALNVAWFHFSYGLEIRVPRLLAEIEPAWGVSFGRWLDGVFGPPEFHGPHRFLLRGSTFVVDPHAAGHYEPFEFELTLCPRTGRLRQFFVRFGGHRPPEEKWPRLTPLGPVGDWVYVIERIGDIRVREMDRPD